MRERVRIERDDGTADGVGGSITNWVPVDTVWAEVLAVSGNALVVAQAATLNVTNKVKIRWRADLANPGDERYRLVWLDKTGEIIMSIQGQPICPDARHRFLQIACQSGQGVMT